MDELSAVRTASPALHSPPCSRRLLALHLDNGVEDLESSLETPPEHEEGSELSGKRETGTGNPFQRS